MQHNKNNIAVIGAGIIGVNCAAALQQKGHQVTLIDAAEIAAGCSQGNAGHFASEQVFPLAQTDLLWQLPKLLFDPSGPVSLSWRYLPQLLPWFVKFMANMSNAKQRRNSTALMSLNKPAIAYYKSLLKAAQAEHLLITKGSLLVFERTAYQQVKKIHQRYINAGIKVSLLSQTQLRLLEPNIAKQVNYALYFIDVGHTSSPSALCDAIAKYSFRSGAKFQQFLVKRLVPSQHHVTVIGENQCWQFDRVVLATGAWSKPLVEALGYHLPIQAEAGYSIDLTENTNLNNQQCDSLSRPVASAERRFIITPMAHGLRIAGIAEFAGLQLRGNSKRARQLYQQAKHILTALPEIPPCASTLKKPWLGHRPSLPDSLPVIGKAPRHHNIILALGHQHLGLTQGAITGQLIRQIVEQKKTDIDITPFCLSRFN